MISIKNLREYGDHGWQWDMSFSEWDVDGEAITSRTARTNGSGDGLWYWNEERAEWKQVRGTAQFSLGRDRTTAYHQIRRFVKRDIIYIE